MVRLVEHGPKPTNPLTKVQSEELLRGGGHEKGLRSIIVKDEPFPS